MGALVQLWHDCYCYFTVELEAHSTQGNSCLALQTCPKAHGWGVHGLRDVLLNGHAVKRPCKYLCLYSKTSAALSLRETCLCTACSGECRHW